ncbi:MAG TPA: hypothetical protein GXZ59_08385 [Clostridiaceae bacterium]|nr:hypothetical protein [Clostridiaceae bacterium]
MNKTKKKFLIIPALVLTIALLFIACADGTTPTETEPESEESERVFTLEELAEFDGQDGRAAYIAVDGVVYDVSDIPEWAGGEHANGRFQAGRDYSEEIRSESPHGTGMLSRAKRVGRLADE